MPDWHPAGRDAVRSVLPGGGAGPWRNDRAAECGGLEIRCAPRAPGVRIPLPPRRLRLPGVHARFAGSGRPGVVSQRASRLETSHSGLVRLPAKEVGVEAPRGFESPRLRRTAPGPSSRGFSVPDEEGFHLDGASGPLRRRAGALWTCPGGVDVFRGCRRVPAARRQPRRAFASAVRGGNPRVGGRTRPASHLIRAAWDGGPAPPWTGALKCPGVGLPEPRWISQVLHSEVGGVLPGPRGYIVITAGRNGSGGLGNPLIGSGRGWRRS